MIEHKQKKKCESFKNQDSIWRDYISFKSSFFCSSFCSSILLFFFSKLSKTKQQ